MFRALLPNGENKVFGNLNIVDHDAYRSTNEKPVFSRIPNAGKIKAKFIMSMPNQNVLPNITFSLRLKSLVQSLFII